MQVGRNINQELDPLDDSRWIRLRNKKWLENFNKKEIKYMRCMTCLKKIPNDNNLISKHMREEHVKDRKMQEQGFRIVPA